MQEKHSKIDAAQLSAAYSTLPVGGVSSIFVKGKQKKRRRSKAIIGIAAGSFDVFSTDVILSDLLSNASLNE